MNNNEEHIEKLKKLTPELMDKYANGLLSQQEQRAIELYLLDNPFEAEAMEGMLNEDGFSSDVSNLQNKLDKRINRDNVKIIPFWQVPWKIAAVISLLITSSIVIINMYDLFKPERDQLALEKTSVIDSVENVKDIEETSIKPIQDTLKEVIKESEETIITTESRKDDIKRAPRSDVLTKTIPKETKPLREQVDSKPNVRFSIAKNETVETQDLDMEHAELEQVTLADEALSEEMAIVVEDVRADKVEVASSAAYTEEKKELSSARFSKSAKRKEITYANNDISESRMVKGTITSIEDGSALPGVNVVVKGTTEGTITDLDGNYEIELPIDNSTLRISFIGYTSEEIEVGDRDIIDLALASDVKQLSEVVMTGQGAVKSEVIPSEMARPIGGYQSFKGYLSDELKYPEKAKSEAIAGKVVVEFYVEADGRLTDFNIIKGLGSGCDEEAIRLIKEGPMWNPAKNEGQPYRKKVRVKVKFEL